MSFRQAVKICFRKYITFSGRASRAEYWYFWLFFLLVSVILVLVNSALFGPEIIVTEETVFAADGSQSVQKNLRHSYNGGLVGTAFSLLVFLPGLAVAWRRLHDTGLSGWWVLAPFGLTMVTALSLVLSSIGWNAMVEALAATGHVTVQGGTGTAILALVVFASFLMLLFWLCAKSQPGQNKYGPNPYEVTQ